MKDAKDVAKSAVVAAAPMAHQAVHDTVVQILRDLPRGKVLDVPAGEGALAAALIEAGFDVRCCDLYPEIFRLPEVEITRGDLNGPLPYDSRSFDYVTCVEGLEHIENPQQALREFARVLRPGGHLVTSVPNILNIEERMKWLIPWPHFALQAFDSRAGREHSSAIRRQRRDGAACEPDLLF